MSIQGGSWFAMARCKQGFASCFLCSASFQLIPSTVLTKTITTIWRSFFIDDANFVGEQITAAFSFLRRKPVMCFILGSDLSLYTAPTMSLVRRLPSASFVARSAVYVRPDIQLSYISITCRICDRHWKHYRNGFFTCVCNLLKMTTF